jgi:hypothetical protein
VPAVSGGFSAGNKNAFPYAFLEGRKEPVIGLQRHPLINRFSPTGFSPGQISVLLAQENLHLVTQFFRVQPLVLLFDCTNM